MIVLISTIPNIGKPQLGYSTMNATSQLGAFITAVFMVLFIGKPMSTPQQYEKKTQKIGTLSLYLFSMCLSSSILLFNK